MVDTRVRVCTLARMKLVANGSVDDLNEDRLLLVYAEGRLRLDGPMATLKVRNTVTGLYAKRICQSNTGQMVGLIDVEHDPALPTDWALFSNADQLSGATA